MHKFMSGMALAVAALTTNSHTLAKSVLPVAISQSSTADTAAITQPEDRGDTVPPDSLSANIKGKDSASSEQSTNPPSDGEDKKPNFSEESGIKFRNWREVKPPVALPTDTWWFSFKNLNYGVESLIYNNFDYIGWSMVQPQLRAYFDTGSDDYKVVKDGEVQGDKRGEIDMFNDGNSVIPILTIFEYQLRNQLGDNKSPWFWGPNLGFGISDGGEIRVRDLTGLTDAEIANGAKGETSTETVDGVVLTVDLSVSLDYMLNPANFSNSPSLSLQAGYTLAFSTEEDLKDTDDGAIFVGIVLNMTF